MVRLLAVPAETHPTQESFLLEVLSRPRPGLEVAVLTGSSGDRLRDREWNAARLYTFPEIPTRRWMRGMRTYLFDPRHVTELVRAVRDFRPEVLLVRDLTMPLLVGYLMRPFFRFRLLYQRTYPHEYRWFDPRMVRRHRLPRLYLGLRRAENRLLHFLMRRCAAVLTISDAMSDQLEQEEGFARERLRTFGMGVNVPQMLEHEWRSEDRGGDGRVRLAYSGTLGISRELEGLVDAFALARSRSGAPDLHLSMFGGADEDVRRLREHAERRGVGPQVEFSGELPREEMLRRMRRCDLAVNYIPPGPRYWVSCPTKQIEYLALGMPSIATDTVAIVLDLARRHGGIALGGPDPEEFAGAILEACRELGRLREEALRAKEPVRRDFSYDAMAARLVDLCR